MEETQQVAEQEVEDKGTSAEQEEEMSRIIIELRQKMSEIDKITNELREKKKALEASSPKQTQKILEEIKVPPLELLK